MYVVLPRRHSHVHVVMEEADWQRLQKGARYAAKACNDREDTRWELAREPELVRR